MRIYQPQRTDKSSWVPSRDALAYRKQKPGVKRLPAPLAASCGLDETSTTAKNQYHSAAHIPSELMDEAGDYCNMLRFLAFPSTTEVSFCILLRSRDPRVLLLMAIWYELVPDFFWWISLRVPLERQSIWSYLGRYHAGNEPIKSFVATFSPSDLCTRELDDQGEWQRILALRFNHLGILAY